MVPLSKWETEAWAGKGQGEIQAWADGLQRPAPGLLLHVCLWFC